MAMADPRPVDADAGNVHVPAANTLAQVQFGAVTGKRHHLTQVAWSYSAAPTGGRLTVEDGAAVVFDLDITAAGPGHIAFPNPLRGEVGQALTVKLAAAGASVVGKVNAYRYTE